VHTPPGFEPVAAGVKVPRVVFPHPDGPHCHELALQNFDRKSRRALQDDRTIASVTLTQTGTCIGLSSYPPRMLDLRELLKGAINPYANQSDYNPLPTVMSVRRPVPLITTAKPRPVAASDHPPRRPPPASTRRLTRSVVTTWAYGGQRTPSVFPNRTFQILRYPEYMSEVWRRRHRGQATGKDCR